MYDAKYAQSVKIAVFSLDVFRCVPVDVKGKNIQCVPVCSGGFPEKNIRCVPVVFR